MWCNFARTIAAMVVMKDVVGTARSVAYVPRKGSEGCGSSHGAKCSYGIIQYMSIQ
jgi:hypothetical protein